jgi:predicted nucleic acid-binding protein
VTPRIMLDTGALVGLERRQHSIRSVHRLALELAQPLVVSTPVVAEWWREGRREKERLQILRTLLVEPPNATVARLAGAAIGRVGGGVVDALVMAAASVRSDVVYTSDVEDLERLQVVFSNVEIARV